MMTESNAFVLYGVPHTITESVLASVVMHKADAP